MSAETLQLKDHLGGLRMGTENCVCEIARPAEHQVLVYTELEKNEGTGEKAHKWWQLLFVSKLCSQ